MTEVPETTACSVCFVRDVSCGPGCPHADCPHRRSAKIAMRWIPFVELPYSRMLADIKAGLRKHDQSTFGSDNEPGTNFAAPPCALLGTLCKWPDPLDMLLRNASAGKAPHRYSLSALTLAGRSRITD